MKGQPKRRYLIDIRTQVPFLFKIGSVWAGGIILLCALLYYLADEQLGRSFYSIHQRLRNTWQILLPAVLVSSGLSFLVTIGATVFLALRESHRLGGPIFKFNKLFKELESGVLHTDFRFRDGDLLMQQVFAVAAEMGVRNLVWLPSAAFPCHRGLLEYLDSGMIHHIEGSLNGPLGEYASRGVAIVPLTTRRCRWSSSDRAPTASLPPFASRRRAARSSYSKPSLSRAAACDRAN